MVAYLIGECKQGDCCDSCECAESCNCEEECVHYLVPNVTPKYSMSEKTTNITREHKWTGEYIIVEVTKCRYVEGEGIVCQKEEEEQKEHAWVDVSRTRRWEHRTVEVLQYSATCRTSYGNELINTPDDVLYDAVSIWETKEMFSSKIDWGTADMTDSVNPSSKIIGTDENGNDLYEQETITPLTDVNDWTDIGYGSAVFYELDDKANIVEQGVAVEGVIFQGYLENGNSTTLPCEYYNNLSSSCSDYQSENSEYSL